MVSAMGSGTISARGPTPSATARWTPPSDRRGSRGNSVPPLFEPGLSQIPRQRRSGCRGFRDRVAWDVADSATSGAGMSRILRQESRDVAESATFHDEGTRRIDE